MPRRAVLLSLVLAAGCASTPDAPAGPRRVASFDGTSIAYDVSGTGDTALVFVHGWACHRGHWDAVRAAFDDRYRTVAVDLGGHGESGATRELWRAWDYGHDVAAVVRALGLERVVLVGHSMGGPVACLAAGELGPRVVAVVGVDTLHGVEDTVDPVDMESWAVAVESHPRETLAGWIAQSVPPGTDPAVVERITADAVATPTAVTAGLLRTFSGFRPDVALAGCPAPVTCINSTWVSETDVEAAQRHARGRFELRAIEGVGHFPMLEDPAALAEHLRIVLARIGA